MDDITACHECDLLIRATAVKPGQKATCPRCGYVLFENIENTVEKTLAVSLAGLIAFLPAITLPIMGLEALGLTNSTSLLECIWILFHEGLYLVSLFVLLFSVIFPLLRLTIMFYLSWVLRRPIAIADRPRLARLFRKFHMLREWGMLEVFMLGIIVALYKLLGLAQVVYGIGLAAFVLLLLASTMVAVLLDEHYVWKRLDVTAEDPPELVPQRAEG